MGDLSAHFSRSEFACHCGCGLARIDLGLLTGLELLRELNGGKIVITSGCRCPEHNLKVGGAPASLHLTGYAADIRLLDERDVPRPVQDMVRLAEQVPAFAAGGIGAYPDPGDRIIHLDVRRSGPARWARVKGVYTSLDIIYKPEDPYP